MIEMDGEFGKGTDWWWVNKKALDYLENISILVVMNETNRNTRTLIVSFVLAIMVLIPLRFVEVGQVAEQSDKQVLGVETAVNQPTVVVEPSAALEEPYKSIEEVKPCVTQEQMDSAWADLKSEIESKQMDQTQALETTAQLIEMEKNICK
jgi:hypothetical protein